VKKNSISILFIYPRTSYSYSGGQPPLGIASLVSYLSTKFNSECRVLDTTFCKKPKKELANILNHVSFDLICFSIMTPQYNKAINMAEICKKIQPKVPVLFGGPHPTVCPNQTISNKSVDMVAIGEGEKIITEIIENDFSFEKIKGIFWKKKEDIIENKPIGFDLNINELPIPDRSALDMERYIVDNIALESVDASLRTTPLIVSRGCPYKCTYCQPVLFKLFGSKIRKRCPSLVVDEMEHLNKKFKINGFDFVDDTLLIDKSWVELISEEILSRGFKITWACNTRANLCNKEMLEKLFESGLRKISIGIESCSNRILKDVYKKGIYSEEVRDAVNTAKKAGLIVKGFFMIGAYDETVEEMKNTIKFASKLPIDEAMFSVTTPLPGTYLYSATKEHISLPIENLNYYDHGIYNSKHIKNRTLKIMIRLAYLRFYFFSLRRVSIVAKQLIYKGGIKKFGVKLRRFLGC